MFIAVGVGMQSTEHDAFFSNRQQTSVLPFALHMTELKESKREKKKGRQRWNGMERQRQREREREKREI